MFILESWEKPDLDRFIDKDQFPNSGVPDAVVVGHPGHRDLEFKSKIRQGPPIVWLNYLNIWIPIDDAWTPPYGDPWLEFVRQYLFNQKKAYFYDEKRIIRFAGRRIINWGALELSAINWTVIPTILAIFQQRSEWGRGGFFLDQFLMQPEPWWDQEGSWTPSAWEIERYSENRNLIYRALTASGLTMLNVTEAPPGIAVPCCLEDCGGRMSWAQAEMMARQPGVRVVSVKAGEPHSDVPRGISLAMETHQFVAFTSGESEASSKAAKDAYAMAYELRTPPMYLVGE